jgi:hypothetical protein
MAMAKRVGQAVLELVGDHRPLTADLAKARTEVQTFSTQVQRTYKDMAAGMSFAGKQASASSQMIAGMGRAGQQAAAGLKPATDQIGFMGKAATSVKGNLGTMFAAFSAASLATSVITGLVAGVTRLVTQSFAGAGATVDI